MPTWLQARRRCAGALHAASRADQLSLGTAQCLPSPSWHSDVVLQGALHLQSAYLNGVEPVLLLLQLPLLLQQLLVAHAAATVKNGAHCLQPLTQDQRLQ